MRVLRRTLLTVLGAQLALAVGLTLVDSYRRRGKKPKPFPTTPPREVKIGDGAITTYTYGRDLYDDMLAAIDGARKQILFETYIWKGDEVGERFKAALADGRRPRGRRLLRVRRVRQPRGLARGSSGSRPMKVLRYPVYTAGWRFFDLRRYGRNHRKILVVDDEVGFVGGYNIGTPYATEWRDTHVPDHRARRLGPEARLRGLLEPQPAPAVRAERASAADGDRVDLGAADPAAPQRAAAVDVPDPVDVPRGDHPVQPQRLDDPRLLHPRPGLRGRA